MTENIYVARQPIFDCGKNTIAYELLFRDGQAKFDPNINGDIATNTVISNSFFVIGADRLLDGKKSFINFTYNLLIDKVPLLLPKQTTIIEILENVEPTEELVAACKEFAEQGYTIALDDFIYTPKLQPLVELASIIKFDLRCSTFSDIQSHLEQYPHHKNIKLLAEKVETNDEFEQALALGFELFQGYFFCKPELLHGKEISSSQLSLMQLIATVNQQDFKFDTLENLVARDVGLSYKLLRYINSAFFAKAQSISSIKQAIIYMGEAEIRRFVSLIALSSIAQKKPSELIHMACTRGKFAELLAAFTKSECAEAELFTLGMFSLIDALIDQPMAQVMNVLPLADKIKLALVERKGKLAMYLMLIEHYEKGEWEEVSKLASALTLPEEQLPTLYLQACQWSRFNFSG